MTNEERTKAGRELAAKLFAGVKRTNAGPLASPLREYTTRYLFGEVWQGKELSLEERSLITCATLIALNRTNEQQVHFQGFKNSGAAARQARSGDHPPRPLCRLAVCRLGEPRTQRGLARRAAAGRAAARREAAGRVAAGRAPW